MVGGTKTPGWSITETALLDHGEQISEEAYDYTRVRGSLHAGLD